MPRDQLGTESGAGLRVIYITGASRCGSTVLATLLGSQPESVSVGELNQLHKCGWLQNDYCSCGSRCQQCGFWNGVLIEWRRRCPDADPAGYVRLQSRLERLRRWPKLRIAARIGTAEFREYQRQTRALLESIAAVSGKRIIIDSSKSAVRPYALAGLPGVDMRVLHLVRDVRASAWSQFKGYRRDPRNGVPTEKQPRAIWKSSLDWILANVLAEQLAPAASDRRLRIRYEDLVQRPEQVLSQVEATFELDLQDIISQVLNGDSAVVGHQIAGNRLRMQGAVQLRGDHEWIAALPKKDRDTCWRIAGWLARRYGYSRNEWQVDAAPGALPPPGPHLRPHTLSAKRFESVPSADGIRCSSG